jgi:hypothetical protein
VDVELCAKATGWGHVNAERQRSPAGWSVAEYQSGAALALGVEGVSHWQLRA